jgi:pimeloyl-ACP methyl ester carboxylesterase
MASVAPGVVHGDFTACDAFDVMDRLGEVRAPARVVVGAEDQLTPRKYSAFLRERLPGEGFLVVPGAGHMVTLEAPEAVTKEGASLVGVTS